MPTSDAQDDLAAPGRARMVAVRGALAAQHFDLRFSKIVHAARSEETPGPRQDRLADPLGFSSGILADDGQGRRQPIAVVPGRTDLVGVGRCDAPRPANAHPIDAVGCDGHAGEVALHIRQHVGRGVADFIEHLLGRDQGCDASARVRRLGQHEAAVGFADGDRIADLLVDREIEPVGEEATGGLRRALEQMADQAAGREQVVVVNGPAEVVHQRPERQGAVDASACDDDVCALRQRRRDGLGTEVGVETGHALRECGAGKHFAHTGLTQRRLLLAQIVTLHHHDAQRNAGRLRRGAQRACARVGIHATGVRQQLDPTLGDLRKMRRDIGDEVRRIAGAAILDARTGHQRQRQLREIVEHQHVDIAALHQLLDADGAVAPKGRGAADAQCSCHTGCRSTRCGSVDPPSCADGPTAVTPRSSMRAMAASS